MKELIREIHRRSLWQVLAIYLASSWVVFEVIQTLTEGVGLPDWLPSLALVLLLIGLPIVLATAFVQERAPAVRDLDPTLLPGSKRYAEAERGDMEPAGGVRKLFTWRNAIMGGVLAFALWGVVAAGWLLFSGGPEEGSVPTAAVADTARKMLVVLPFENLGPPEDEYFADGLTEEITARLAGIGVDRLGVIGRTTAVQYEGTDKGIRQIGEELDVDYILEGTVRWERAEDGPSRVRVTPQLIRTSDATHVWVDMYDEVLAEIFGVQSQIASRVVEGLEITLLEPEQRVLRARSTQNVEAYDFYLRGRDFRRRGITEENLRRAEEMYQRAVELDPTFAVAYARLAEVHGLIHWYYFDRSHERLAMARRALDRARELDPDLPEVHRALGDYHYRRLEYDRALDEFGRARELVPNEAEVIASIAYVQRRKGDAWDASMKNLRRALELDPLSEDLMVQLGISHLYLRQFESGRRAFERARRLAPEGPRPYVLAAVLEISCCGDTARAGSLLSEIARRSEVRELDPRRQWHWALFRVLDRDPRQTLSRLDGLNVDPELAFMARAELYSRLGNPEVAREYADSARSILEDRVRDLPSEAPFHSQLALALAALGRTEEAVAQARQALELEQVRQDALIRTDALLYLAQAYTVAERPGPAIETIEKLLAQPGPLTEHWLRLDPTWAPLHDLPEFRRLLEPVRPAE